MVRKVKCGKERWWIVEVYVGGKEMERKLKELQEWVGHREKGVRTIIGDFNTWTGRVGGKVREEEEGDMERSRCSKDGKINREGRLLVNFIEERGWMLFNGRIKGG